MTPTLTAARAASRAAIHARGGTCRLTSLLWLQSPPVVLLRDPGSGGSYVIPPAPGFRPASGHVAVEEVRPDPHGREPENPRPEPPRAAQPPRYGQKRRPLGDPHGYRLGPPGEHHVQFPTDLLSKIHPSPSLLIHGPPHPPRSPGDRASFLQLVRDQQVLAYAEHSKLPSRSRGGTARSAPFPCGGIGPLLRSRYFRGCQSGVKSPAGSSVRLTSPVPPVRIL